MRLIINKIILTLSTLSALFGLIVLGWILVTIFIRGIEAINFDLLTKDLIDGGIRNLLLGQLILSLLASIIAIPIGILAGIFIREYGNNYYAKVIRTLNEVMLSAPSIVIGAFIYGVVVIPMGKASGIAGILALAVMMIPIVLTTTDSMLSLVPKELREAGIALGARKSKVIIDIILRAAKTGIITGILLAFARIFGETAPLLFTSETSNYFNFNLTTSFPSITVSIYDLANEPSKKSQEIAWAASFVLTIVVLIINLISKIFQKRKK